MSLENQNSPATLTESDEVAIRAEANRLIADAAQKGGYTVDQIPQQARNDAYSYARNAYVEERAKKANPLYAQLEAEREAHKRTKLELSAARETRIAPHNDVKPVADVARVRGLMGERDWHALTDAGRLASCGIPPATVTPVEIQEAKSLFGRGADSHFANDYFKRDAGRYRHLKNIAIILNLQGA